MDVNNYVHSYCHNVINNVTLLLNIIEQNIKCTAEQIHTERISTITEMLASMMLNSMLSAFQQLKCLPALLLNIIEQNINVLLDRFMLSAFEQVKCLPV